MVEDRLTRLLNRDDEDRTRNESLAFIIFTVELAKWLIMVIRHNTEE